MADPSTLQSLAAEPPILRSLAAEPPILRSLTAEPPILRSLAAEPPILRSLTAEPPILRSLAAEPPILRSLAAEPPILRSLAAEPPILRSLAAEPPILRSLTSKPPILRSLAAEPPILRSLAAEPPILRSLAAEPPILRSLTAEPPILRSLAAEPPILRSLPGRGASHPAEPGRGASHPAEPGRGASHPAEPGRGASHPAEPGRGASHPAEPGRGASHPAEPGRGASHPAEPGRGASHPAEPDRGASHPAEPGRGASHPAEPGRGASHPAEPGRGASHPAEPGRGASHPAEPGRGASHPAEPGRGASHPAEPGRGASHPAEPGHGASHPASQPTPCAPGQERSAAPPPCAPGQDRAQGQDWSGAPSQSAQGQDWSGAPSQSAQGQDWSGAPSQSAQGQDWSGAPSQSAQGQDWSGAPSQSAQGQDWSGAPSQSAQGQDWSGAPSQSAQGQDWSGAPSQSAQGQDWSGAPSQSAQGQDRSTALPPSAPGQEQEERTQDTLMTNARKSMQAPINGTPKEKHRVQPSHAMIQDWGASSPLMQNQLTALQHSDGQDIESGGRSPLPDTFSHGVMALPNYTGAQDSNTTHGKGTPLQADMRAKGDVADGSSQSSTLSHLQNITTSIQTFYPEDTRSAPSAGPGDTRSAPAAGPGDTRSAPAAGPGDTRSAPAAGPEDTRSAPAAGPEDTRSAPAAGPEDMRSVTIISPILIKQEAQQRQGGGAAMGNLNSTSQNQMSSLPAQPSIGRPSLSPIRVPDPSSPHRNISSKPPLPIPSRSNLYPGHPPREQENSASHETVSLASFKSKAPAPDTLSYLDSVSLMSGTMESLTLLDDASSLGSDSEINGMPYRKTDKYGFLGGNQFSGNSETAIPVEIARQRELKWLDMFSNWDKWLTRRFQKVKLRCRKGIPSSLRAKAWQYLCNGHELLIKNPGKFEEMERQQGDPKWLDVIEKDLHRQFPFHEMFAARGGHGQQDLYRILKAYTVYRPEEGYCQAQAPVAAVLLMHMPAEQAFWCLVQICDKYLPGYYSAGLEAIQLDGEIFFALLRRVCPMAYRHLKKFKIDPILYMTEWFMCIFSRTLPWASVLRVWDMFFCEGVKIVFRVGLVLLRHTLGSVDKLRSCQGMYETMEKLRSLPVYCMQEEVLLPEVSSLPVTDSLIERESNTQLRKWRENRGELQYRPSRRLHGARQIHEEKLRLNPTLSGSRLSLSSMRRPSPPATPALAAQPESLVVSEGLRPALPSPTSNKAPLGPPKEATKKGKEKQEKKREKEEREQEKKKEKEEREERKKDKEREKQKEKEEKRAQKEREKAESRQKKERKFSFRRKESSSAADSPRNSGSGATDNSAAHDTYF
ncbi:TBC1 domain family member 10B [Phyllobates terribilis]|uniref:TBC1 domain family member 10B n=1 Tax=Phyllobates terribilis TaxID=111132 RepID=UPI003CCA9D51